MPRDPTGVTECWLTERRAALPCPALLPASPWSAPGGCTGRQPHLVASSAAAMTGVMPPQLRSAGWTGPVQGSVAAWPQPGLRQGPCRSRIVCGSGRGLTSLRGTGRSSSPAARLGEQLFSSCSLRGHREDQSISAATPSANETSQSYSPKRINTSGCSGSSLILTQRDASKLMGVRKKLPLEACYPTAAATGRLPPSKSPACSKRAGSFKSPGWSVPSSELSDTGAPASSSGCSPQCQPRSPCTHPSCPFGPARSKAVLPRGATARDRQGSRGVAGGGQFCGTEPCREGAASPSCCQGATVLSCDGHPRGC